MPNIPLNGWFYVDDNGVIHDLKPEEITQAIELYLKVKKNGSQKQNI